MPPTRKVHGQNPNVVTAQETKHYVSLTSTTFKNRYDNHQASFIEKKKKIVGPTELGNYIWKLKEERIPYQITREILKYAQPYLPPPKKNPTLQSMSLGEVVHHSSQQSQYNKFKI